ncbi:MAG TPA: response regulator [Desulfomonilaceae bacterium]|nr:response regulator [Desulfomonilaceae bacterium]
MPDLQIIKGKRILAVDDEPDVLEVIQEQLVDCEVFTARNYEAARELILERVYDLIILDIMGVNGFALLELSKTRRIPAAMLTAHALTVENVNRALKLGAVSFLPKDELARLPELIAEILNDISEGKSHWEKLFERLGPFFEERLGLVWEDLERPQLPPYRY